MRKLLAKPWARSIGSVYCSAEQKAIDGAEILSAHLSIGYRVVEGLGEIDRSATGYLPEQEHAATAALVFAHPERSIRGWETARHAQQRIVEMVKIITERVTEKGNIAIVSHGGVGTLYLCHLADCPISCTERQPGSTGGNYYCFDAQSGVLIHSWRPIDS